MDPREMRKDAAACAQALLDAGMSAEDLVKVVRDGVAQRRRAHRFRIVGGTVAALAATLVVAFVLHQQLSSEPELDAPARAEALFAEVRAAEGKGTPELKAKLWAALEDESSLVRRHALLGLNKLHEVVPEAILFRELRESRETLDHPIRVADSGPEGMRQALTTSRGWTLSTALTSLWTTYAQGAPCTDPALVESFTMHPDADIRVLAYWCLSYASNYVPSEDVLDRLAEDTDKARQAGARLLDRKN